MTYRIIDLQQNTPEWEAFRKGKIGASMAPAIMGESPWETPLMLWESVIYDKKKEMTPAMQRGREKEQEARDWINRRWGVNYQPAVLQSDENPQIFCSLDGFFIREGEPHLIEIKCPGASTHAEAVNGDIPRHYQAQLQHQMMVSGAEKMYYVSYVGEGEENVILFAEKNEEYCKLLLQEELRFLDRIIEFMPPDPMDADWLDVKDPDCLFMAQRLKEIQDRLDDLESEEADLKMALGKKLQHDRCKIGSIKAIKIHRRGNIDYSQVEALKGINLEPYRKKPVSFWKFQ